MVQINWQEEARRARRLWVEAHKHVPAEVLQQALSGADVEQPLDSSLALVPEQTGAYSNLLSTCFLLYKQVYRIAMHHMLSANRQACVVMLGCWQSCSAMLSCQTMNEMLQGSYLKQPPVQAELYPCQPGRSWVA